MGYRYPDKYELDEEARKELQLGAGFDEQFESGPNGEIFFYRGGIGRPVRVSDDERADACERWERHSQNLTLAYVAVFIFLVIACIYFFDFDRLSGSFFAPLLSLVPLAGYGLVQMLLRNHIVRPFRGRFPAGPERTRWMRYSAKADGVSWKDLAIGIGGLILLVAMRSRLEWGDMSHMTLAVIELALGSGIFLIAAIKLLNAIGRR